MFKKNNLLRVFLLIMAISSLSYSQIKDMVITKTDGSKSYISVGAVDNITFSAEQTGTVTDVDGNTYNTVKIGNQWWMAENLKVTHYRNGSEIPNVTDRRDWYDLTSGAYCYYGNDSNNGATYGCLYNWYAVNTGKLAPEGWHVATDDEWEELEDYLTNNGHSGTEGTTLKSTSGWEDGGNGTDDYGFAGLPAGRREYDFSDIGRMANFWSATEDDSDDAWCRYMWDSITEVYRSGNLKSEGYSVRCVRD